VEASPAHPNGERWDGTEPSLGSALWRACLLRCPRCGQRRLFRRWFRMQATCPRCGLILEPEEGAFLGSMTLNYAMTAGVFILVLVGGVILTAPDIPVAPLLAVSIGAILAAPVLFYPFTKTLWATIHHHAHRGET